MDRIHIAVKKKVEVHAGFPATFIALQSKSWSRKPVENSGTSVDKTKPAEIDLLQRQDHAHVSNGPNLAVGSFR